MVQDWEDLAKKELKGKAFTPSSQTAEGLDIKRLYTNGGPFGVPRLCSIISWNSAIYQRA